MKIKIYSIALCFSMILGFSFVITKVAVYIGSPIEILAFRFLFAMVAIMICLFLGLLKMDLKGKNIKLLLIPALFYSFGFYGLQLIGFKFSTSIAAGMFFALNPIITSMIAEFALKEKVNTKQRISIYTSVVGIILIMIFGGGVNMNIAGSIFLFLASCSMAVNSVSIRWMREQFTSTEVTFASTLVGCVGYNSALFVSKLSDGTLSEYFLILKNVDFLLSTLYLGVLALFASNMIMSYMLRNMQAARASIFANLATLISVFAGAFILNEKIMLYQIIFAVFIIAGVFGTNYFYKSSD